VTVRVDGLTVTTLNATVFEDPEGQACLRELVPWGWTVDPANGSKIARTLVLASLYTFLSEVTRRGSSTAWRLIAQIVYALGWFFLFGVDPAADVPEEHRRKLAELILDLYKRWCAGFAYPGPRCSDEHHGVYLGCVEIARNGAIRSFDMWEGRRHVVTGPLLAHWGQQLGLAPIDVIAGRFAQAMCCLGSLPPIALPPIGQGDLSFGGGRGPYFHVGTFDSVGRFGKSYGSAVSWLSPATLSLRMTEAFTTRGLEGRPVEVLATKLPDGGSVAIAVPREAAKVESPKLRDEVMFNLRHTPVYVRESGREAVADFTVDLLRTARPTMLLNNPDTAETHKVAEALDKAGATAADVAEDGSAAVLYRSGLADNKANREGAANLVEHAEKAVDNTVKLVVKVMGSKLDRSSFGVEANQKALAETMKDVVPKLSPKHVVDVAARTAGANVKGNAKS
jgi:imidazoleglycerol phosphate dehydratase HisB